jgi:vancomycin resistance protein YoaR
MKKKYVTIIAIVTIAIIAVMIAVFSTSPSEVDRIYTHIYIHGVPVGGMTIQEAEAALMERFQPLLEAQLVAYTINGQVVAEFTFKDFGARFDFRELTEQALAFSSMRNLPRRLERMFGRPHEIVAPAQYFFKVERIEDVLTKLSAQFDQPPRNAIFSISAENNQVVVSREVTGHGINIREAALATQNILNTLASGTVALNVQPISPRYTEADFKFTTSLIGFYQTSLAENNSDARMHNVRLASERIHNQVLYPGQVFSAGGLIRANLPNSGYKPAIVLVRGEPVEDIGGGVCQVVTTLYNAVLRAELEIVQRHNHSARVSYADVGFDATIAGDYLDLKFKNSTDRPLLITSRIEGGQLHVGIIGYESRPAGRTLRFIAHRIEMIPPEPYREVIDPTIPTGERFITLESQMGYHVELFKYVFMGGEEIERVKINTSIYKPLQGVIAIGAG